MARNTRLNLDNLYKNSIRRHEDYVKNTNQNNFTQRNVSCGRDELVLNTSKNVRKNKLRTRPTGRGQWQAEDTTGVVNMRLTRA